jgi:hypothetical protein
MNRLSAVALLVVLVVAGAVSFCTVPAQHSQVLAANGGGPIPPWPDLLANGGGPIPPWPDLLANGGGPIPPWPDLMANGGGPIPPWPDLA